MKFSNSVFPNCFHWKHIYTIRETLKTGENYLEIEINRTLKPLLNYLTFLFSTKIYLLIFTIFTYQQRHLKYFWYFIGFITSSYLFSVFHYQIPKLAGGIGVTEMTRNHISKQGRKCISWELWSKDAEKNRILETQNMQSNQKRF